VVHDYDTSTWLSRYQLKRELRRDLLPTWNMARRRDTTPDSLAQLPAGLRERIGELRGRSTRWAAEPKPRLDAARLARDIAATVVEPNLRAHIGAAAIDLLGSDDARSLGFAGEHVVGLRIVTDHNAELAVALEVGPIDGVGGHVERLGRREEVPAGESAPVRDVARL